VLAETADQFHIVQRALEALAAADVDAAKRVASSLNTQSRRDEAFTEILRTLYDGDIEDHVLFDASEIAGKVVDSSLRENEINRLFYTLHSRKAHVIRYR
jgi:hypothetical protein